MCTSCKSSFTCYLAHPQSKQAFTQVKDKTPINGSTPDWVWDKYEPSQVVWIIAPNVLTQAPRASVLQAKLQCQATLHQWPIGGDNDLPPHMATGYNSKSEMGCPITGRMCHKNKTAQPTSYKTNPQAPAVPPLSWNISMCLHCHHWCAGQQLRHFKPGFQAQVLVHRLGSAQHGANPNCNHINITNRPQHQNHPWATLTSTWHHHQHQHHGITNINININTRINHHNSNAHTNITDITTNRVININTTIKPSSTTPTRTVTPTSPLSTTTTATTRTSTPLPTSPSSKASSTTRMPINITLSTPRPTSATATKNNSSSNNNTSTNTNTSTSTNTDTKNKNSNSNSSNCNSNNNTTTTNNNKQQTTKQTTNNQQ